MTSEHHQQARRGRRRRGRGRHRSLTACGGGSGDGADRGGKDGGAKDKTVTLVAHDSFTASDEVLKQFTAKTGYTVEVLKSGDAGEAVNKAVLTKGAPAGRRVLRRRQHPAVPRPRPRRLRAVRGQGPGPGPPGVRLDADKHRVTPVDYGDICVNYDKKYFADKKLAPPQTLDDLVKPAYKDLLVVENPERSSPGLGFLLGTVAAYGDADGGWRGYWKKLKDNGVKVVDSWEIAYNQEFSGSSGGKQAKAERPLVVSYASSPPAEVPTATRSPARPPRACPPAPLPPDRVRRLSRAPEPRRRQGPHRLPDRQGVPGGHAAEHVRAPRRRGRGAAPELFTKHGVVIDEPLTMAPDKIAANRDQWIQSWSSLVLK